MGDDAMRFEPDAPLKGAVGDSGGGEEHLVASHQVGGGQDPAEVVAGFKNRTAFVVAAGDELPEHVASEAP